MLSVNPSATIQVCMEGALFYSFFSRGKQMDRKLFLTAPLQIANFQVEKKNQNADFYE